MPVQLTIWAACDAVRAANQNLERRRDDRIISLRADRMSSWSLVCRAMVLYASEGSGPSGVAV